MVAAKNHENGSKNPLAQYPFKVTVEAVLESVLVADPLRILDCSPITDGAAAVVLTPVDVAKSLKKPMVRITGTGHATDTISLSSRRDLCWLESTHLAAKKALAMAGRKIGDIDLFEVHDCFTIAEIMVIEALGIVEKGRGGKAVEDGLTALGGKIPGQSERRAEGQGPPGRRHRRRPGGRDRQAAAGRGGRAPDQERPARPDPEHGRHGRQLARPRVRSGVRGEDHAESSEILAGDPAAIPARGRQMHESAAPSPSLRASSAPSAATAKFAAHTLAGTRGAPDLHRSSASRPARIEDQAPYAVGIADLDDGVQLTAQVVDCDFEALKVGMRVRIEFRRINEDGAAGVIHYGYKFVPA